MPTTAAIIAEYNPFHKGHAYQIEKTREETGADFILVILSGDFVQRGAPAVFDKYSRTRMALLGGADVVLELPVSYACASAEYFARGAVGILDSLHAADILSFGSEAGDVGSCMEAAQLLLKEPELYRQTLKEQLKKGRTYPAARKEALLSCLGADSCSTLLDFPNNILGIEYCKALSSYESRIRPFTIKREGNGYHETSLDHSLSSATALRKVLFSGDRPEPALPEDLARQIRHTQPEAVFSYMEELLAQSLPLREDDFSLLLKYRFMLLDRDSLCRFADLSADLANRICKKRSQFQSFSQFISLLKTKELTYTRISRCLLHILLSIEADLPAALPSYVRLLGFKKTASPLLRTIRDQSCIPLITKAADYRQLLSKESATLFEKDVFAADLYESVLQEKLGKPFVSDLAKAPVILDS